MAESAFAVNVQEAEPYVGSLRLHGVQLGPPNCAVERGGVPCAGKGETGISTAFYWILLIVALSTSVLLSLVLPREPAPLLLTALVWIGTVGLVWQRWMNPSGAWLGRLAAGLVVVLLAWIVHGWLPATDVFIECNPKCPRPGSFWPLVFVWLLGGGLLTFSLWGDQFALRALRTACPRSVLWWSLALPWTAACAYVLTNNLNMDVVRVSFTRAGWMLGGILAFIGAIVALALIAGVPGLIRQRKAAADFARIDDAGRQAVLERIDRHSRAGEFLLLYRPLGRPPRPGVLAHAGGDPLASPGERWPAELDLNPGTFLLQLPLEAPRLGPAWQNRVLVVFLVDHGLVVRSYGSAEAGRLVRLPDPSREPAVRPTELEPLALPYAEVKDDDEADIVDGDRLLANVPGLKPALDALSRHPAQILAKLLAGRADAFSFAANGAILVGGDPQYIQNPHEPKCPECGEAMRFLLQFCDVTEDFRLGDAGVGYVYGCDAHADRCAGFVDCF